MKFFIMHAINVEYQLLVRHELNQIIAYMFQTGEDICRARQSTHAIHAARYIDGKNL